MDPDRAVKSAMSTKIVECVPNFSEGRDTAKIKVVTDAVQSVPDAILLHVDRGADANRTVVTFLGTPEAVAEAAFRAIAKAAELIDMRAQHGEHPRLGATDVCPFVPIQGVTLDDCAAIAHKVGRRVGEELGISVFFYEAASTNPNRKNLADIRRGEYEGLPEKLKSPLWKPDCGPATFNPKSGATVIGAREFLIAFNITLNTPDKNAADDIAAELREKGRIARAKSSSPYYNQGEPLVYRENHYPCGNCAFVGKNLAEIEHHCLAGHGYELRSAATHCASHYPNILGQRVHRAGEFPFCKAIGWYVEEYGRAQISMNLTNYHVTPPHIVLERARELAADRGLVVTGSELIGMIPYAALLDAGKFYLARQNRSADIPINEILEVAVDAMSMRDVRPFDIAEKVIGLPSAARPRPAN
jgi:glutamate formiminotransferase / formiminotetrahydrofolate cyclodeaminase